MKTPQSPLPYFLWGRRSLLRAGAGLFAGAAGVPIASWAANVEGWKSDASEGSAVGRGVESGPNFDLTVARSAVAVDGKEAPGITINGHFPGPLLRWREGEEVTLRVHNTLAEDTSIHWHGILLPFQMDGVPGVTFPGIAPGDTFIYRFPVSQAGTYWYHSHSGLQEPLGHYGPIVVSPAGEGAIEADREHVLVLSDWTQMHPHRIFSRLKKMGHAFNFQQRTVLDFFRDAATQGWGRAIDDRMAWGSMRMNPADIADVTGATYTYLVNGQGPQSNWTGRFEPGEQVRLRVINAASMTIFNIRIPGLPMSVVSTDGLNVQPVEVDEFQIGPAETYDLLIKPREDRAYTFFAESIDRSGYARATLAPREGMTAEVPKLRERPLLTMRDMGMAHHGHGGHGDQESLGEAPETQHPGHSGHSGHSGPSGPSSHSASMIDVSEPPSMTTQVHNHPRGPGVINVAEQPANRMHEPGIGLEAVGHRVLTYTDLKSLEQNCDQRPPGREMEIHLTSNMERYMWSFDGVKFSEVTAPIEFQEGERLRVHLVNDTMMPHPIHLHGMFFQLVNGETTHKPNKHTVVVKPGEKLAFDVTADAVGDWAFHCHLLYHMHAGMMQVVSVKPAAHQHQTHG